LGKIESLFEYFFGVVKKLLRFIGFIGVMFVYRSKGGLGFRKVKEVNSKHWIINLGDRMISRWWKVLNFVKEGMRTNKENWFNGHLLEGDW